MQKLRGFVIIINTLLPAIILAALAVVYFALAVPVIDDLKKVEQSVAQVRVVASAVGEQYNQTKTQLGQYVTGMKQDFASIIGLHGGVRELSQDFCKKIGKVDLSTTPTSVDADKTIDVGQREANSALEGVRRSGEKAARFGNTQTCRISQEAFQLMFAVLGILVSPFDDMGLTIQELETLYQSLNVEAIVPQLENVGVQADVTFQGVLKIVNIINYMVIGLFVWFAITYLLWVPERLQRGWRMLRGYKWYEL